MVGTKAVGSAVDVHPVASVDDPTGHAAQVGPAACSGVCSSSAQPHQSGYGPVWPGHALPTAGAQYQLAAHHHCHVACVPQPVLNIGAVRWKSGECQTMQYSDNLGSLHLLLSEIRSVCGMRGWLTWGVRSMLLDRSAVLASGARCKEQRVPYRNRCSNI